MGGVEYLANAGFEDPRYAMEQEMGGVVSAPVKPDTLVINAPNSIEVMRIAPDGRIFWRGREVVGDDDFRAAMLDVHAALCKAVFSR